MCCCSRHASSLSARNLRVGRHGGGGALAGTFMCDCLLIEYPVHNGVPPRVYSLTTRLSRRLHSSVSIFISHRHQRVTVWSGRVCMSHSSLLRSRVNEAMHARDWTTTRVNEAMHAYDWTTTLRAGGRGPSRATTRTTGARGRLTREITTTPRQTLITATRSCGQAPSTPPTVSHQSHHHIYASSYIGLICP